MAAVDAEEIGRPGAAIAIAAGGGDLAGALGAEVVIALDACATGRAAGDDGLAEEEIQDGTHAGRHHEADQHPDLGTHMPPGCVVADVPDHQHVQSGERTPGDGEVDAHTDGRTGMMAVRGKDDPVEVLDTNKGGHGQHDGPARDELEVRAEPLWLVRGHLVYVGSIHTRL